MYVESFKELVVWQRSMELAKEIYKVTEKFPKSEQYGLSSQMRRAAVSIPSNIAEGKKRRTRKDFTQFLRIAAGSAAELETQVTLSKEFFKEINFKDTETLLEETQKMLTTMIKKLETTKS